MVYYHLRNLASESAAASSIDYSATITSSYPAATSYAASSYVMSSVDSSSYDVLSTSTSSSYYTTSTSSSYSSVQSYGSGSNSWDSSSYDSCVQRKSPCHLRPVQEFNLTCLNRMCCRIRCASRHLDTSPDLFRLLQWLGNYPHCHRSSYTRRLPLRAGFHQRGPW